MQFNPKYNHINTLFGELGWVIGCLGNSSRYNERFIDIADRVTMLNGGIKTERRALKKDIESMLVGMESEGYRYTQKSIRACAGAEKHRRQYKLPSYIKITWKHIDDGKLVICFLCLSLVCLILMGIMIPCVNDWNERDPFWVFIIFYSSLAVGFISGGLGGINLCAVYFDHDHEVRKRYKAIIAAQ